MGNYLYKGTEGETKSHIKVMVNYGFHGEMGWHGSHHSIEVNETETLENFLSMLKHQINKRITLSEILGDKFRHENLKKTVKECGFVDGMEIDVWNGKND